MVEVSESWIILCVFSSRSVSYVCVWDGFIIGVLTMTYSQRTFVGRGRVDEQGWVQRYRGRCGARYHMVRLDLLEKEGL